MTRVIFIFAIITIFGCSHKSMTLDELQKANWTHLENGYSYISLEDGDSAINPHFHYQLKAVVKRDGTISSATNDSDSLNKFADSIFSDITSSWLLRSKEGYIKINFCELLIRAASPIKIFLKNSYDTSNLEKDMSLLSKIDGIKSVTYVSKEKAREIYLNAGNEDWTKVLGDENPLPRSIELTYDPDRITPENYNSIMQEIEKQSHWASSIKFPLDIIEPDKTCTSILKYIRD